MKKKDCLIYFFILLLIIMDLEENFKNIEDLSEKLNKRIMNKDLWKNFEKNKENIKILTKKEYLKIK